MRLLAWNIRQGGGTRLVGIMAAIARHDADVLVLSEYRGGDSAERLRAALTASGYRHVTQLVPPPQGTGVLIAARRRFVERGPVCVRVEEPWRLVDVDLGVLRLTGVYMPNLHKKVPYWQTLVGRGLPLDLIETVCRTAREAGRDPAAVEITVGMPDDLAQLADFAAAGVSRVLLPVTGVAGLARKVSGPEDLLGWRDTIARFASS